MRFLALCVVGLALAGCMAQPATSPEPAVATALVTAGARLAVTVADESDLSGTYTVAPDGTVQLPLVGKVAVAGQTPDAAASTIETAYRGKYLKYPDISVAVRP